MSVKYSAHLRDLVFRLGFQEPVEAEEAVQASPGADHGVAATAEAAQEIDAVRAVLAPGRRERPCSAQLVCAPVAVAGPFAVRYVSGKASPTKTAFDLISSVTDR